MARGVFFCGGNFIRVWGGVGMGCALRARARIYGVFSTGFQHVSKMSKKFSTIVERL